LVSGRKSHTKRVAAAAMPAIVRNAAQRPNPWTIKPVAVVLRAVSDQVDSKG
jgi:hypothetical protein